MSRPSTLITLLLPIALTLLSSCMGEGKRMLGELERLEALNQSDTLFTSDSAAQRLVTYYDRWYRIPTARNRQLRMRAYYMLGSAYRDMGESPKALESFQLAVEASDTTSSNYDIDYLMRIHSQMSELYLKQRLLDEELKELDIAEHLAWKIKDTLSALIFCEYKCHSLYNKGEYEKCIKQTTELSRRFHESGYSDEALLTYTYCINSCFALGRYSQMKEYITKYEECNFIRKAPQKIAGERSALYIFKGQYYQATEQADSAIYYFRKALTHIQEGTSELLVYKGLFQAYGLQHNADSVLKYTSLYAEAKDRNFDSEVSEAIIQSSSMYRYERNQRIAIANAQKAIKLKYALTFALAMAFAIVLLAYRYYKKKEARLRQIDQEYMTAMREHEQIIKEYQILKQEYNRFKTSDETTELIRQKQKRIDFLERYIGKLRSEMGALSYSKKEKLLQENETVVYFIRKTQITPSWKAPAETMWRELAKVFSHYMPLADSLMRKAELSRQERYTCILAYLNLSTGDIATLLGTSISRISNVKNSASTKLFGDEQGKLIRKRLIEAECTSDMKNFY